MRSRGRGQENQTRTETHLAMCLALARWLNCESMLLKSEFEPFTESSSHSSMIELSNSTFSPSSY